jgi:hypothetical protein
MDETIFIQIASYRDPQLPLTIKDCIKNARYPENLRFCICWQRDETENLDEFLHDSRFTILEYHYTVSKGVCWARNKIQQHYNNEIYTLQLDSHHRFVQNWDTILINMIIDLQNKGNQKPLITAYLPSFNPENDPEDRVYSPWEIVFDKITDDGSILTRPKYIENWQNIENNYIPAKFYSAHFTFTIGLFAIEVQHDPELYFTGEELNIAARAYTHGYDLFHPNLVIAWHEYTRNNRIKQWDDDEEWWKMDEISKLKNRLMFNINKGKDKDKNIETKCSFKNYNLGNQRSLQDYFKYAELYF